MEVEASQDYSEGKIETVSIDSVHLNKNWSLLMVELEMHAGTNKIIIPYKIDTRSEGNIMPCHIFKRLFKNVTEGELKKTIKRHIKLRTYNKTVITQLDTSVVTINSKNIKKSCVFFVVPGNGQALLGMPDTAAHKIININIDSIQAVEEECNTNIGDTGESNTTQEAPVVEKSCTNTKADSKVDNNINSHNANTNVNSLTNYFFSSPNVQVDKRESIKLTQRIHKVFGNVFNGIGCFKGTFSLQLKPDSKPHQVPPRCVAYVLQKLFKEELDHLQKMDIITPLGVDETMEWCNSFVLVPKVSGKVRVFLDLVRLNQVVSRPVHRGPMLNDILPKLNNVQCMSIIDVSSGYHKLKLDEKSSYLTTFTCPFGQYWYNHLQFGAMPAGDMFRCKRDKIFSNMPNVFGIADDIFIIGYDEDGADHDVAVHKVLQWCEEVNLKHNKEKCHFRCMSIPFFGEVISRKGVQPDPYKVKALMDIPPPNNK